MDYIFQPEVIQKVGGILLNITSSKQAITFQHSQEWKCSAENINMLVSYECEERKLYCFAIKIQNNHWNYFKQASNLPVTHHSQCFLFSFPLGIKMETDFYMKSLLSFRKIPKCFIGSYIAIKTAMEWSHSFTSAQTACANFSESLTKKWSNKPNNGTGYHKGAWKNILLLQHTATGSKAVAGLGFKSCQGSLD